MAKPTVFLSSTCYDLSIVREELDHFLRDRGFEVSNSESRSFGVTPGKHSHSACISAVRDADFLLLLIGRRRGGTYVGSTESITSEEYRAAQKASIPCIVCVDRLVNDHRLTYRKNPSADHSHVVDDTRIFHFIDNVASGQADNWIHPFSNIGELKEILTTQFSHYLRLFSQHQRKPEVVEQQDLVIVPFPSALAGLDDLCSSQDEVTAMRDGLFAFHEILRRIQNSGTKADAKGEKIKMLWVLAFRGECNDDDTLSMEADNFKQYAWSTSKGRKVNNQLRDFGIKADYSGDETDWSIYVRFEEADEAKPIAAAAQAFAKRLLTLHSERDALELFARADMRCFAEQARQRTARAAATSGKSDGGKAETKHP